jgi:hypothetical protein
MLHGISSALCHREVRLRLVAEGWRWIANGDWAHVYASPDGSQVARVVAFDPAYALHVRTCLENPDCRFFPRIDWHCALAPAGQIVLMERLDPPDDAEASRLCCLLGQIEHLEQPPGAEEVASWLVEREREPALMEIFDLLRATAALGEQTLGWFGGLDVRPGNVMQDETGQHKLIDPYFVAGPRLMPAILEDVEDVSRHYSREELRGFLEIAVFEDEQEDPGPVLQQLRECVARLDEAVP